MRATTGVGLNELLARAGWGCATDSTREWWLRIAAIAERERRPDWLERLLADVIRHGVTLNHLAAACSAARAATPWYE